jgi:hypothetical protein
MSNQIIPPNEEHSGLDTYLKWTIKRGLVIYSSGGFAICVFSIFALLPFDFANKLILSLFSSYIFFIVIFIASYQLWKAEREDKISVIETVKTQNITIEKLSSEKDVFENESRQLRDALLQRDQDRKPQLSGSVITILHEQILDNLAKDLLGTRILLLIEFVNSSQAPTTISDFVLDITLSDGGHWISHAGVDPTKFGLLQQKCLPSPQTSLINNQWLLESAPRGQKAMFGEKYEGWLFFDCPIIKSFDDYDLSSNIILKAVDAFNAEHKIEGGLLKSIY